MNVEISQITCDVCNVMFWITKEHDEILRKCHNTFYCPNGHSLNYKGETDRDKIKGLEKRIASLNCHNEELLHKNSALRGVITKLKKGK